MAITTPEQERAIAEQVAVYERGGLEAGLCRGLDSYQVEPVHDELVPEGTIEVRFNYIANDGHIGLEITVFDREGKAIDSQDFG